MLYDKRWNRKVEADVFSLAGLIEWLKKQNPEAKYCYEDNGGCLLHKYFTARGLPIDGVGGEYYRINPNYDVHHPLPDGWDDIAAESPWTFGAALDRAWEYARVK